MTLITKNVYVQMYNFSSKCAAKNVSVHGMVLCRIHSHLQIFPSKSLHSDYLPLKKLMGHREKKYISLYINSQKRIVKKIHISHYQ